MPDLNGITLTEAQNALAEAITARSAILQGQSVRYNSGGIDRQVTMVDLNQINADIILWENRVRRLTSGGVRVRGVTFL